MNEIKLYFIDGKIAEILKRDMSRLISKEVGWSIVFH